MGLFASLMALVGCDNLVTSQIVYTTGANVGHLLQFAGTQGPLGVEAMGEVYGLAPAALAPRIVASVAPEFSQPWLRFEPDRTKATGEYRLVYLFDARTVRQPDFAAVCAGRAPRYERDAAKINVHVVLCGAQGPVVAIWGWLKRPESFDDPALRRLLVQMTNQAVRGAT